MNIAIFGANGRTGNLLTQLSLSAGHDITLLTRQPGGFHTVFARERPVIGPSMKPPSLHVVRGSIFDPTAVRETIQGADAVLSALGAHSPLRNENLLPRAIPTILEAMHQTGTRRIIVLGSAGALPDSLKKQPAWRRWIVENIVYKTFLKWPVIEQIAQYKALAASNLDWTMVMPPMLTNGPARGRYRIDGEALPPNGSSISRADVANFMVQQLESSQWQRKGVYITD